MEKPINIKIKYRVNRKFYNRQGKLLHKTFAELYGYYKSIGEYIIKTITLQDLKDSWKMENKIKQRKIVKHHKHQDSVNHGRKEFKKERKKTKELKRIAMKTK